MESSEALNASHQSWVSRISDIVWLAFCNAYKRAEDLTEDLDMTTNQHRDQYHTSLGWYWKLMHCMHKAKILFNYLRSGWFVTDLKKTDGNGIWNRSWDLGQSFPTLHHLVSELKLDNTWREPRWRRLLGVLKAFKRLEHGHFQTLGKELLLLPVWGRI